MIRVPLLTRAMASAVVGLAFAGTAASTDAAAPQSHVISMQITGFEPAALSVRPGDRITWINKDLFPHTATADDKAFDSGSVAPAGKWTYVARKAGLHTYTCTFHPTMKASITVR
jgi:plastocyanin